MAANLGGRPVSVVAAGGAPFVRVTAGAPIATPVEAGAGPPITLVNDDGTQWEEPEED